MDNFTLHAGIISWDIDADIMFASTTPISLAEYLSDYLKLRIWKEGHSLRCSAGQKPIRVVQYQNSPWSTAFPVDLTSGKLSKLFTVRGMLDFSLGVSWNILHLRLSNTSDIYSLREYRMGYGVSEKICSGDNNTSLLQPTIFKSTSLVSMQELEEACLRLKLLCGNIDGGARNTNGDLYSLEEIELRSDLVTKHYLLL